MQVSDSRVDRCCTQGNGHNKEILMICLNKECQAGRLCCLTCIDEFHRKHQLISLNKFEHMLLQLDQKHKPQAKYDVEEIVKQQEIHFNQELDDSLQRAINEYNTTKKQMALVFQEVFSMIKYQKPEKTIVEQFYTKFDSKNVNHYLKKINEMKFNSYENPESALATIKKAEILLKTQIKDFEVGFTKLMEGFTKCITGIKTALTQSNYVPAYKKFSKTNKAACLEVSESQNSTKRIEGSGGYPINLLDTPVTKENNEINIKITEEPGNRGIWMGVAILNIVKNNNFLSSYGIGKGTYAIDQVGASHASAFSWNHHDTTYNSQPKVGWQFNLGDTVNIKVDFNFKTVTFTRGVDQYSQPVRLEIGDLYFFAGPTNINDQLAIV